MTRLMVTGGRDYGHLDPRKILEHPKRRAEIARLTLVLDEFRTQRGISVLVHGDAKTGADARAKLWALSRGIMHDPFPAAWDDLETPPVAIKTRTNGTRYNVLAGFARNQKMIDSAPIVVIAFPGGNGTADAVRRARAAGIEIMEIK